MSSSLQRSDSTSLPSVLGLMGEKKKEHDSFRCDDSSLMKGYMTSWAYMTFKGNGI